MGGGKKSKAPEAPNYAALASTEAAENRKTAQEVTQWNRPTQNNPFGQVSWQQDGNGNWTQNETWDPRIQAGYDSALNAKDAAMSGLGGAFQGAGAVPGYTNNGDTHALRYIGTDETGKVPDFVSAVGNYSNNAGAIADYVNKADPVAQYDPESGKAAGEAMYNSYMSRAGRDQEDQQLKMQTQLRQQGLQPGTAAYDRAYKNLLTSHGDANAKAQFDSQVFGGNESRSNYGSILAGQNQQWSQGIGDQDAMLRTQGQRHSQGIADYQAALAGDAQKYSQYKNAIDTNTQRQAQKYDQYANDYQMQMAAQNQQYGQADADYSRAWDTAGAANNLVNSQYRPTFTGFSGATGYNPADMSGAAQAQYQSSMGGYSAGQQGKGNLMNMGGSMMGGYLGGKG